MPGWVSGCLISNKREWNNCFVKNNRVILVGLADFLFKSNQKTIYGHYFSGMVYWLIYHGR